MRRTALYRIALLLLAYISAVHAVSTHVKQQQLTGILVLVLLIVGGYCAFPEDK